MAEKRAFTGFEFLLTAGIAIGAGLFIMAGPAFLVGGLPVIMGSFLIGGGSMMLGTELARHTAPMFNKLDDQEEKHRNEITVDPEHKPSITDHLSYRHLLYVGAAASILFGLSVLGATSVAGALFAGAGAAMMTFNLSHDINRALTHRPLPKPKPPVTEHAKEVQPSRCHQISQEEARALESKMRQSENPRFTQRVESLRQHNQQLGPL